MRKLMYFTIGFTAACAMAVYAETIRIRLLCTALLLLFGAMAGKDARPLHRAALVLLGCMAGFGWYWGYHQIYLQPAALLEGEPRNVEIRVSDYSWETDYGTAFDGRITLEGKPYQIRGYLNEEHALTPGDYLYGSFRFRLTTPDGERESSYYQGKGIFLLAYQADAVTVVDYPPTRRDIPARIRQYVKEVLAETFPEDTHPFAKALLIGDTSDLSYETDTDFKISGIRHVVAVSGLHVSILFTLISILTFRKKWFTALVGFPVLLLFAAVAGFSPSVSRACMMSGLMLLAMLAGREYDGATALSFAVLVILAVNPLAVTSVSLQLSVASVAGIFLFESGIRKWMVSFFGQLKGRTVKSFFVTWLTTSVSISLSAMVLTTPLCAWYFGMVSLIAPLTNLLALWVTSFLFYGIIAVVLLWSWLPAGAVFLGKCLSIPVRYVLLVAKTMADVPMAAVYTASPYIVLWLIFVYVLLLAFLVSSNRKPLTLSCCAVIGLCIALIASWTEPMLSSVRFTVLDVGQGQCLLFQADGKNFLVDCGGDSDTKAADLAAQTLLSQGIARLDGLILTHFDRDHAGGVSHFLSRMETDLLILPAEHNDLKKTTSARIVYGTQDLQITAGDTIIRIFAPRFPGNSNEMSLCILFDTENCDILITGDRSGFGERSLLRYAQLPDVDILVAGHHGSRNATCEELLRAVKPEVICISAGQGNAYGHPAPELLQRLAAHGCTVYRTDQHGTIIIRR